MDETKFTKPTVIPSSEADSITRTFPSLSKGQVSGSRVRAMSKTRLDDSPD